MVDILRHYSNRTDVLDGLVRASRLLEHRLEAGKLERQSVYSSGRIGRVWALEDRLSEELQRKIAHDYADDPSYTRLQLAEKYGISRSSVGRILRKLRATDRDRPDQQKLS
jgi:hypothetical protein